MGTLVLIGKSGSGKDTVCVYLKKKGMKDIVCYTTRPMREGETNHKEYHFISKEEFEKKRLTGFFAETRAYTTAVGVWSYGTSIESLENADNCVIICTPISYKSLLDRGVSNLIPVYLHTKEETLRERLMKRAIIEVDELKRKDLIDEIDRRLASDRVDFECMENSQVFEVDTDLETPESIANLVYKYYKLATPHEPKQFEDVG